MTFNSQKNLILGGDKMTDTQIKKLFTLQSNDCKYFIQKNGKLLKKSKNIGKFYFDILCIINHHSRFDKMDFFPYLYGDENLILDKLLILHKAQEEDLYYMKLPKTNMKSKYPDENIMILRKEYVEDLCVWNFLSFMKNEDVDFYRQFYPSEYSEENLIKYFAAVGIDIYLHSIHITKSDFLNRLFYYLYIHYIEPELIQKYGKSLRDFYNYHELYLFLKKHGYVKLFFSIYGPKIWKQVPIFIQMIKNHPKFHSYVNKIKQKHILPLKKLSIQSLIQKYVPSMINKEELWTRYTNLIERK